MFLLAVTLVVLCVVDFGEILIESVLAELLYLFPSLQLFQVDLPACPPHTMICGLG